jgi:hypothetical protein
VRVRRAQIKALPGAEKVTDVTNESAALGRPQLRLNYASRKFL